MEQNNTKMFKKKSERRIFKVVEFMDSHGDKVPTFEQCTIVMCYDVTDGLSEPHSRSIFNHAEIGDCYIETITREPMS